MFRHTNLEHKFVHYIPEQLEPGVIYISMEYATAAHSCCCGCGEQVITPFTPTDWELTFDGETVSLWPSIGNWNFRCRSHYVIRNNRIVGVKPWSDKKVEHDRLRDKWRKQEHFGENFDCTGGKEHPKNAANAESSSMWDRIKNKVRKRRF